MDSLASHCGPLTALQDNQAAVTPVLLDFFDADRTIVELSARFTRCVFRNNRFAGEPSLPSLIVSNSNQNRLIVEETEFSGNDMVFNNAAVSSHVAGKS